MVVDVYCLFCYVFGWLCLFVWSIGGKIVVFILCLEMRGLVRIFGLVFFGGCCNCILDWSSVEWLLS